MNTNNILTRFTLPIVWLVTFTICALFLHISGSYNFCFSEQFGTFFYDSLFVGNKLCTIGGCASLIADWLIQFFKFPIIGVLITAALLSTIVALFASTLHRLTSTYHLSILAALPVCIIMLLHFNVNYLYSGTVAFLFMAVALAVECRIKSFKWRYIYSLLSCIVLYIVAGPIALLYAILLLVVEMSVSVKRGLLLLVAPLTVVILAYCCLQMGVAGEWKHLLLPDAYFTLRLKGGSSLIFPWSLTLVIFIAGAIYKFVALKKRVGIYVLCVAEVAAVTVLLYSNTPKYVVRDNEIFKELNYMSRYEMWDDIITRCKGLPMTNVIHQNYLNMALAEKGRLFDEINNHSNIGIQSLFISGNKTPYISALLSDIYYTMGHMAFSRRYAFEANESAGGYSPKLLQRLVLTSIIYNENALALKYISLLEKTLFYNDWAQQMRAYIQGNGNAAISAVIDNKKRCLFPDNRFSGSKGLDKDLEDILKCNPSHTATNEYLKTINLFLGTK